MKIRDRRWIKQLIESLLQNSALDMDNNSSLSPLCKSILRSAFPWSSISSTNEIATRLLSGENCNYVLDDVCSGDSDRILATYINCQPREIDSLNAFMEDPSIAHYPPTGPTEQYITSSVLYFDDGCPETFGLGLTAQAAEICSVMCGRFPGKLVDRVINHIFLSNPNISQRALGGPYFFKQPMSASNFESILAQLSNPKMIKSAVSAVQNDADFRKDTPGSLPILSPSNVNKLVNTLKVRQNNISFTECQLMHTSLLKQFPELTTYLPNLAEIVDKTSHLIIVAALCRLLQKFLLWLLPSIFSRKVSRNLANIAPLFLANLLIDADSEMEMVLVFMLFFNLLVDYLPQKLRLLLSGILTVIIPFILYIFTLPKLMYIPSYSLAVAFATSVIDLVIHIMQHNTQRPHANHLPLHNIAGG